MFESAFGMVSKFVGGIIGDEDDDDDDVEQGNGVSYKDHQLLRITPKSLKQVRLLQELRESEPDDVKFWTIPTKDKYDDFLSSRVCVCVCFL